MDADEDYPVSVGPTVLPEIWAPRLYAQGLHTGGRVQRQVAFTAQDKHASTWTFAPFLQTERRPSMTRPPLLPSPYIPSARPITRDEGVPSQVVGGADLTLIGSDVSGLRTVSWNVDAAT
jgi:hypothetical protein